MAAKESPPDIDPDQLLLKVSKGGSLSEEEIEAVVLVLSTKQDGASGKMPSYDDEYSCLLVIGKAKLTQHRQILERYLDSEDPLTVALVLDILCLQWKETEEYLERVLKLALGVPWDDEEDVRMTALKVLGEYIFGEFSPEKCKKKKKDSGKARRQHHVLGLVYSVFEDKNSESWTRQAAYCALLRAYGTPWEELPSECRLISFDDESPDLNQVPLTHLNCVLSTKSPT